MGKDPLNTVNNMKKSTLLLIVTLILSSVITVGASEASPLWGDANGDGFVNINDVTCIQRHVAELQPIPEENRQASLVSGETTLSVLDATLIQQFLAEMFEHFPAEEKQEELSMKINNTPVQVEWENNEAVAALKESVKAKPLTIQMSMYGGFEQVGSIGTNLPANDVQTTTSAGDIVLYSGNQMVVFYGSNSWAYTRLGHITDKTDEELTQLLSNGNVTVTLSN